MTLREIIHDVIVKIVKHGERNESPYGTYEFDIDLEDNDNNERKTHVKLFFFDGEITITITPDGEKPAEFDIHIAEVMERENAKLREQASLN